MHFVTVFSILVALSAPVSGFVPSGVLGCDYAQSFKQLNLPFVAKGDASTIDHSAVLLYSGDAVGWLFQTRGGRIVYEDGPVGLRYRYHKPAPHEVATAVLGFLLPRYSATEIQKGNFYPIPGQLHLNSLIGLNLQIKGCY